MTRVGPASAEQRAGAIEKLHEFFSDLRQPLYALFDTARDRRILPLLESSGCEYRILYGKELAATMNGLGPHLVALPPGIPFPMRLIQEAWGNSWGIFFTSPADLQAVRRHLRRQLYLKLPDGRPALFRFYDPQVLRDYLPSCDQTEIARFFGPINSIFLESITGERLHSFGLGSQFACEKHPTPQPIQHSLKLA